MKVIQRCRAERVVVIDVEADDMESAVESVVSGAKDVPAFEDPRWNTYWDLVDEETIPHTV